MKLSDFSVASRWNEFKMIPASVYDVFVLRFNNYSEADEAHVDGEYDSIEVFRDFTKAEEHILHILGFDSFKGLEVYDVDYVDGWFVYKASNESNTNFARFEIKPTKFIG